MQNLLERFKTITSIPHCSRDCEKLREYIVLECKKSGAIVEVDEVGNILASRGNPKICLQSHYDMVCVGNAPKIEIVEKDGCLMGKNSSLGADNGIGVAMGLEMLKIKENIEVLFTIDEEIGLIGATNLNLPIKSKYLLNLDSEEEGGICLGCAGGIDIFASIKVSQIQTDSNYKTYSLKTKNFKGGHSGVDIDKNIKNAIKELSYFIKRNDCKIYSIFGGEAGNAIPKSVEAIVLSNKELEGNEFIEVKKVDAKKSYLDKSDDLLNLLVSFPSGVRSYDKGLSLVQTSINLATIKQKDNFLELEISPRAMSDDKLDDLILESKTHLEKFGFNVESKNRYPAWKPEIGEFAKEVLEVSKKHFRQSHFYAIHAGLECGVILKNSNIKEAVSIGPNIFFPHSIDERVEIESIKKVYEVVKEIVL